MSGIKGFMRCLRLYAIACLNKRVWSKFEVCGGPNMKFIVNALLAL